MEKEQLYKRLRCACGCQNHCGISCQDCDNCTDCECYNCRRLAEDIKHSEIKEQQNGLQ